MSSDLVIINTEKFEEMHRNLVIVRNDINRYSDFLQHITGIYPGYPGFGTPYLALFPDGFMQAVITLTYIDTAMIKEGVVPGCNGTPLDEYINNLMGGSMHPHKLPLTAIVEFSKDEIYPDIMNTLQKQYNIQIVRVQG